MRTQPKAPTRAPLSMGTTTPTNPALMARLAAIPADVEYGQVPNVINLPAEPVRGAA